MKTATKMLLIPFAVLALNTTAQANPVAQRYLNTALNNCERGVQSNMPRSPVALAVLQRYHKKYQNYKDAALQAEPSLADSSEIYNGEYMNDKSYAQMIGLCDSELSGKVKKAETAIQRRRDAAKQRAREVANTRAEREQLALAEAVQGIESFCIKYLTPPNLDTLTPDQEGKLSLDRASYDLVIEKARTLWPEVISQQQAMTVRDATGRTKNLKYSIEEWGNYCADLFTEYRESLTRLRAEQKRIEDEGGGDAPPDDAPDDMPMDDAPMDDDAPIDDAADDMPMDDAPMDDDAPIDDAPMDDTQDDAPVDDAPVDDAGDDNLDDEELKEFIGMVKGDRVNVLKEMKRVPDYTDNDDKPEKAKQWMYENEDGTRCDIYSFKGDTLGGKTSKKECPM